jgi:hypothetical protein
VIACFDSDASTNRSVALAMRRLGRWLISKGAKVRYCIVPPVFGSEAKTGVDDFLASGGTVGDLLEACVHRVPDVESPTDGSMTDSRLAGRWFRTSSSIAFVTCTGWAGCCSTARCGATWGTNASSGPSACIYFAPKIAVAVSEAGA